MPVVADLEIGQVVRFLTKAPNDNNVYNGKIIAECNSTLAKFYSDIVGYNEQVKTAVPGLGEVDTLNFIVLDLLEPLTGSTVTTIAIAKEWIDENTLVIIAAQSKLSITVYDADENDADDIIAVLRGAGFNASIL